MYSYLQKFKFGAAQPFQDRLDIKKVDSVELYAVVPEKVHAGVYRVCTTESAFTNS